MSAVADLHATDAFTDLVLHVLAHVSATGPEDLFDPRYVAWANEVTPEDLRAGLHETADVLAHRWNARDGLAVQAWPELFREWSAFAATRARPLADVHADEVARPDVLARLQGCDASFVELLHAQLALLAPWFATLHARVIAPTVARACDEIAGALAEAVVVVPAIADARIELAWPLGPRGRGFADRIVVGAPAPWNSLDRYTPVVLALHEQAVQRASPSDWTSAEWLALVDLATALREAPARLARAHAEWLAALDLAALVTELVGRGTIDAPTAERLSSPHDRARWLADVRVE